MYVCVYVHAFTHNAVATYSVCAHAYLWHANAYTHAVLHTSPPISSGFVAKARVRISGQHLWAFFEII